MLLSASLLCTALLVCRPVSGQTELAAATDSESSSQHHAGTASRPQPPDAPLKAAYPDAPTPQPKEGTGVYMVNNRPYHPPTSAERMHQYTNDAFGLERFGITAVSAAYAYGRNDPKGWDNGIEGYGKHLGSAYGQSFVSATVRAGMSAALHEDTHYIVCHGCTLKQRINNSVLSEFTARRGMDGHRALSLTPAVSNYAGPLVSHNLWYPDGYDSGDAAIAGTTGFATHIGFRFAREVYDMYKTQHGQNRN